MAARRRALALVSVVPVWTAWAVAFFWLWPWQPALGHFVALAFLGMTLVEVALAGAMKIPCTCSYLPGKSHVHVACAAVSGFLPIVMNGARFELDALEEPTRYAAMLGVLCTTGSASGWLTTCRRTPLTFDDEPAARQSLLICGTAARVEIERPG